MKSITPFADLSLRGEFGSEMLLRNGVEYVVPDNFPARANAQVGPGCLKATDYAPDNLYRGEDLNGKSLFCFRSGGIGDLLFISTSLRQLKKNYPTAALALGCDSLFGSILDGKGCGFKQITMPLEKRMMDKYDYILFFQGIIEGNPEAETKNAYDLLKDAFCLGRLDDPLPSVHIDKREKNRARDFVKMTANGRSHKVVIQVSASVPKRSAPPQLYADFIRQLPGEYMVFFIGGKNQYNMIDLIIGSLPELKRSQAVNASRHLPSLAAAAALIGETDLVIGPDSSMLHVAAAFGKPLIGLYGPFPSDLRLRYYKNAVGLDVMSKCEFARGEYRACFEHGDGVCMLAGKTGDVYSPCMMFLLPRHIFEAMEMLKFPVPNGRGG